MTDRTVRHPAKLSADWEVDGLREAMAACRAGDTLVVAKLDRLARFVPDTRDMVDELTRRHVNLNLGGAARGTSNQPTRWRPSSGPTDETRREGR